MGESWHGRAAERLALPTIRHHDATSCCFLYFRSVLIRSGDFAQIGHSFRYKIGPQTNPNRFI